MITNNCNDYKRFSVVYSGYMTPAIYKPTNPRYVFSYVPLIMNLVNDLLYLTGIS